MDAIERRRAAARKRTQGRLLILLAAGGAAFLLLVAGAGVLAYRQFGRQKPGQVTPAGQVASAVAGVSAEREGETWNHTQLLAHLRSHGIPELEYVPSSARLRGSLTLPPLDAPLPVQVFCSLHGTPREAHDAAGENPGKAFAWGRFSFYGGSDSEWLALLTRIKAALGVTT